MDTTKLRGLILRVAAGDLGTKPERDWLETEIHVKGEILAGMLAEEQEPCKEDE